MVYSTAVNINKLRTYQKYIDNPELVKNHKKGDFYKTIYNDVKERGIINPLIVEPEGGIYRIKIGNNRYLAALDLGIEYIMCIIGMFDKERIKEIKKKYFVRTVGDNW